MEFIIHSTQHHTFVDPPPPPSFLTRMDIFDVEGLIRHTALCGYDRIQNFVYICMFLKFKQEPVTVKINFLM
jgi:hypothetical protein